MITFENVWVLNEKPGALSLKLPDPMVILKPRRHTEPLCRYCFKYYTPEENSRNSCGCHANTWGEDGFYLNRAGGEWTCCGATSLKAPHCSTKQHASGAHMIHVSTHTFFLCAYCHISKEGTHAHVYNFYPTSHTILLGACYDNETNASWQYTHTCVQRASDIPLPQHKANY
jgi:hypothetical protein